MSIVATTETKPAPPPVDKLTVKVDGIAVEVPRTMPDPISGKPLPTTMTRAGFAAKADVPHCCQYQKLAASPP
jgi:hypothetical protein